MLKLLKYEFRRARFMLCVLAAAVIALEAYFLISMKLDNDGNVIAAAILLGVAGTVTGIAIFASGIVSYSSELKNKTSYLVFMTPNATVAVMTAKMLYAMIAAVLATAALGGLALWDITLLAEAYDEYFDLAEMVREIFETYTGIEIAKIAGEIAGSYLSMLLTIIRYLVTAYLAITFSATLMKEMRARGIVTFVIYILLNLAVNWLTSRMTYALNRSGSSVDSLFMLLLPSLATSVIMIVVSLFGSARMLEKKVSL